MAKIGILRMFPSLKNNVASFDSKFCVDVLLTGKELTPIYLRPPLKLLYK